MSSKKYCINDLNHNINAKEFFENLKGKKVAICGIGVNNTPVALQFMAFGAIVTACDKRQFEDIDTASLLKNAGVQLCLGECYLDTIQLVGADMIIRTPGMKPHLPQFNLARQAGIIVTSEMELFFSLCPAPITAVTGSDGKTTTTSIIAGLFEKAGNTVHIGGNIGRPLLPTIDEIYESHQVVVEISSFQLMLMNQSPKVAVITNISPNHLDWHSDMDEYIEAKKNLIAWQKAGDKTILNADDETLKIWAEECESRDIKPFLFSRKHKPRNPSVYCNEAGDIFANFEGTPQFVMHSSDVFLKGVHNVENYLAAFCAVSEKVKIKDMAEFATEFTGVAHRCEFVREVDGAQWYNDSMASSPSRTVAGLKAFERPVVYIGGGYDKNIPYDVLGGVAATHVKVAILFGATADKIEKAIRKYSDLEILRASDLADVVRIAKAVALPGDVVFFSPASASFDMYKNFAQRGDHFKELVSQL